MLDIEKLLRLCRNKQIVDRDVELKDKTALTDGQQPPKNKAEKQEPENTGIIQSTGTVNSLIWPLDHLPPTKYITTQSNENLSKIEKFSDFNISNIKPKKLVDFLTALDIELLRDLEAKDLMNYGIKERPESIKRMQTKNIGLLNFLSLEMHQDYLLKMMKEALKIKNYNLLNVLVKAIQGRSIKRIDKVVEYQNEIKKQAGGISPFEWMFKDSSDSNFNKDSSIASMRFVKIIDRLKEMKEIRLDVEMKEKYRQILYGRMWKYYHYEVERENEREYSLDSLYLLL